MDEDNGFVIEGRLPSLNEVIDANRRNPRAGAKLKRDTQSIIRWYIKMARMQGILRPIDFPCEVYITWYEPNAKRDVDNIESSVKFILDALVEEKIMPNDSQRWVRQIHHDVKVFGGDGSVSVSLERAKEEVIVIR